MKTLITLLILALLGTGVGYYIYKEANKDNIKKLVQQVLDDNKIPVHIDELNLKADPKQLLRGIIDRIEIKGEITTVKKKFRFDSALQYKIENSTISLQASPLHLQLDELPKIDSVIGFYVKYKRIGTKIDLQDIHAAFVFDIPKAYKRSTTENTISFSKAHFENSLVYRFDLDSDRFILNSRGVFSDLALENQHTEFSEKAVEYTFSAKSDGTELHAIKFDLISPVKLNAAGSIAYDKLDLQFATHLSFDDALGYLDRIAKIPFLERVEGKGSIHVIGKLTGTPEKPQILSNVSIDADEIEIADILGDAPLKLSDVRIETDADFPFQKTKGTVDVDRASLANFAARSVHFDLYGDEKSLRVTNNSDKNPVTVPAFGSTLSLSNIEVYVPFHPTRQEALDFVMPGLDFPVSIRTALHAGPFVISAIQKDFCLLNNKPLEGVVTINYPSIYNRHEAIYFEGQAVGKILGGNFEVGDLKYDFSQIHPNIHLNTEWYDLDLHALGELTNFGDMRGSLDGSLKNASYSLTSIGPIPLEYDFMVKGRKRSGKDISFYGRAVDNILELLGSRKSEMPWYAQLGINASMWFRNVFPAKADYMGFRAKTSGGWTELFTFDPDGPEKDNTHYLLYGTAFKIPLNSHGVYPALMKTDAFQGWLWGMVDYFQKMAKERELKAGIQLQPDECTPFWNKTR